MARIIGYIALAVLVVFAVVVSYIWATLARPLPPRSAQEVGAAQSAFEDLVGAWCADNWDKVWTQIAGLGKVEGKRDTYIEIWRSHKAEDFPVGVSPDELEDVRVFRLPIGVLKIWIAIVLPPEKVDTGMVNYLGSDNVVSRLTAKLFREGVVCLRYKLQGKPYVNIIMKEDGVWRPMVVPADLPADSLDE